MITLRFLFAEPLCVEEASESKEALFPLIRAHLGLDDPVRYEIRLLPDPDDPATRWVLVDDRVYSKRFRRIEDIPSYISKEIPKRTVWINPPVRTEEAEAKDDGEEAEEKDDEEEAESRVFTKKRYYPWDAAYTEYFQLYYPEHPERQTFTIRYWKTFEQLEMIHPTDLATARYEWLRHLHEESASSSSSSLPPSRPSSVSSCLSPSCPLCQGDASLPLRPLFHP